MEHPVTISDDWEGFTVAGARDLGEGFSEGYSCCRVSSIFNGVLLSCSTTIKFMTLIHGMRRLA
jgi:hypothetical protein